MIEFGQYLHEKWLEKRNLIMNKSDDKLEQEYDLKSLGKGLQGKYFEKYQKGTNVVVIDPELSKALPNAKAVNDALRKVLEKEKQAAS